MITLKQVSTEQINESWEVGFVHWKPVRENCIWDMDMTSCNLFGPLFQNLIKIYNNLTMFTKIKNLNQAINGDSSEITAVCPSNSSEFSSLIAH